MSVRNITPRPRYGGPLREDVDPEERQERILNDGSRWEVYKRYFTPEQAVEYGLIDKIIKHH